MVPTRCRDLEAEAAERLAANVGQVTEWRRTNLFVRRVGWFGPRFEALEATDHTAEGGRRPEVASTEEQGFANGRRRDDDLDARIVVQQIIDQRDDAGNPSNRAVEPELTKERPASDPVRCELPVGHQDGHRDGDSRGQTRKCPGRSASARTHVA